LPVYYQNGFGCWSCFRTIGSPYLANIGVTESALYPCGRSAQANRNVLKGQAYDYLRNKI
jgi:hypothetical protein